MALMNDYFWATIFGLSNMNISVLLSSILLVMGEIESNKFSQMLSGQKQERTDLENDVFFW